MKDIVASNNTVTLDDIEYYTQGSCHELAIAACTLLNGTPVIIWSENGELVHVMTKISDNLLFDINGFIDINKLGEYIRDAFYEDNINVDITSMHCLMSYVDTEENCDNLLTSFTQEDIGEATDKIKLYYGKLFEFQ